MSESETEPAFQAPEPDEVALLFPAYEIHGLIACGGMGAVYRATQSSLDREVAIKILPEEFSKDAAFRAAFESEAKAMGKLNHPNLVGVYDFGEVEGMLFIVMEYVHGQSLFDAANGNAVEKNEAMRLMAGVCRGLGHAHKHGVLHRDIKPGNVLLDESLQPKIGDFGLARALESEFQEGEQIFGTPGYTAPEVTIPPFAFDHRADIFSVGVMLRELLTGVGPVAADGSATAARISDLKISSVIKKATHENPKSRYSSADELADDLEKIVACAQDEEAGRSEALRNPSEKKALPSVAARRAMVAQTGTPYMPKTFPKKKSSSGTIVVLVLLAALGGVVFLLMKKPPGNSEVQASSKEEANKPKMIVIGDPPSPGAETSIRRRSTRDSSYSPIIPLILNSGPVIQQGFDVPDFLKTARGVMRASLAPDVRDFQSSVEENTKAFRTELDSLTENWKADELNIAEASLAKEFEDWQKYGFQIPKELPVGFRESFTAKELHEKHLKIQRDLREPLVKKAEDQKKAYVIGLEYQIDHLRDTDNEEAIGLLEKEVEKTKVDSGYFVSLMLD